MSEPVVATGAALKQAGMSIDGSSPNAFRLALFRKGMKPIVEDEDDVIRAMEVRFGRYHK